MPPPLGPPYEPRHVLTVGSYGVVVSYESGTPVGVRVWGLGVIRWWVFGVGFVD